MIEKIITQLKNGDSVLIQGVAGSGKSHMLNFVFELFKTSIFLVPNNQLKKAHEKRFKQFCEVKTCDSFFSIPLKGIGYNSHERENKKTGYDLIVVDEVFALNAKIHNWIENYHKDFPEVVFVFLGDKNQSSREEVKKAFNFIKGEYFLSESKRGDETNKRFILELYKLSKATDMVSKKILIDLLDKYNIKVVYDEFPIFDENSYYISDNNMALNKVCPINTGGDIKGVYETNRVYFDVHNRIFKQNGKLQVKKNLLTHITCIGVDIVNESIQIMLINKRFYDTKDIYTMLSRQHSTEQLTVYIHARIEKTFIRDKDVPLYTVTAHLEKDDTEYLSHSGRGNIYVRAEIFDRISRRAKDAHAFTQYIKDGFGNIFSIAKELNNDELPEVTGVLLEKFVRFRPEVICDPTCIENYKTHIEIGDFINFQGDDYFSNEMEIDLMGAYWQIMARYNNFFGSGEFQKVEGTYNASKGIYYGEITLYVAGEKITTFFGNTILYSALILTEKQCTFKPLFFRKKLKRLSREQENFFCEKRFYSKYEKEQMLFFGKFFKPRFVQVGNQKFDNYLSSGLFAMFVDIKNIECALMVCMAHRFRGGEIHCDSCLVKDAPRDTTRFFYEMDFPDIKINLHGDTRYYVPWILENINYSKTKKSKIPKILLEKERFWLDNS